MNRDEETFLTIEPWMIGRVISIGFEALPGETLPNGLRLFSGTLESYFVSEPIIHLNFVTSSKAGSYVEVNTRAVKMTVSVVD